MISLQLSFEEVDDFGDKLLRGWPLVRIVEAVSGAMNLDEGVDYLINSQRKWIRYAASGWAFLFAAVSFYWALGGKFGAGTVGVWAEQAAQARDPEIIMVLWITGLTKALLGLLSLALVYHCFRFLPGRLLILGTGFAGVMIALYALANIVQHGLMISGVLPVATSLGRSGLVGHLILWDPWWMLGGVLFLLSSRKDKSE